MRDRASSVVGLTSGGGEPCLETPGEPLDPRDASKTATGASEGSGEPVVNFVEIFGIPLWCRAQARAGPGPRRRNRRSCSSC